MSTIHLQKKTLGTIKIDKIYSTHNVDFKQAYANIYQAITETGCPKSPSLYYRYHHYHRKYPSATDCAVLIFVCLIWLVLAIWHKPKMLRNKKII